MRWEVWKKRKGKKVKRKERIEKDMYKVIKGLERSV